MASFICDSNLPPILAEFLRTKGHKAAHTFHLGMTHADDSAIWDYADKTGAIIVTKDHDFERDVFAHPGSRVILVCLGNCSNAVLLGKFDQFLAAILGRFESGIRLVEMT